MVSRCHCHSLSLAPVNPDWFYLPGFTFLVPSHPGSPGQNPQSITGVELLNFYDIQNADSIATFRIG